MDKKLIIVLGVFLTVALCVAALHGGDDYHEEIPFKSIDDPDVQSQVLESIMENSDLVLTIETTDSVTIKPATVRHSVSYNAGITTVTIFDYIGQKFHVVVGDSSDVYLFGVTDKKEYDKENKTVTIVNDTSKKPKMTIKLLSSEPDLTTFTEIFEVTNFEMYTPDSDLDFKARSVVQKGRNSVFKTEWFIEVNQSYVVNITDYKATQFKKEVYNNKTGKNETIFVNETVISGYHDETRYRNVWSDYNKYGTKLAKNTIQKIKVVYHKKAELGDVRIQTVPVFAGVECEELTWWNTSWDKKREIQIDNTGGSTLTYYQVNIDLSSTPINSTSLRVVNETADAIVPHWQETISSGNCTDLWFKATSIPASLWLNETYYIYYSNDASSLSSSITDTFIVGDDGETGSPSGNWTQVLTATIAIESSVVANGAYSLKVNTGETLRSGMYLPLPNSNDYVFEYSIRVPSTSSATGGGLYDGDNDDTGTNFLYRDNQNEFQYFDGTYHSLQAASINVWYDIRLVAKSLSVYDIYIDSVSKATDANMKHSPSSFNRAKVGGHQTNAITYIDDFRVRKYTATEPTATLGAEEEEPPGDITITSYAPTTPITLEASTSQLFNVTVFNNSQCRWYLNTSLIQTNSTPDTNHSYTNGSLNVGYYNVTAYVNDSTDNDSQTWWVTVVKPVAIPPDPTDLTNTTGNFWIRHAWNAGSGNITDGYNVSVNGSWYNTTDTFINLSKSPHGYQDIMVQAWNESGAGLGGPSFSTGNLTDNVTLANNPVTLTNYSILYSIQEFDTVSIDFDYTDADGDVVVFGTNAVNGTFDNATGLWSWTTTWLDRSVNQWTFNVSDGYGSVDSVTIEIEVTAYPITELSENWQYHDSDDPTDLWDVYTATGGSGTKTSIADIQTSSDPYSKYIRLYASVIKSSPGSGVGWAESRITPLVLTSFTAFGFTSYGGYTHYIPHGKFWVCLYDMDGYEINNYDLTNYITQVGRWEFAILGGNLYLTINGDNKGIIGTCGESPGYIRLKVRFHSPDGAWGVGRAVYVYIDDITTGTAINGIGVDHSDAPQYANTHTWADSELWTVPPTITTTYGLKTTPVADYTDAEYTMKVQRVLTSEYVNTTIIKPAGEAPNSTQKPCGSVSLDQPTLFGDNYGAYNFLIDKDGSTIATDYIYWMNMEVSGNSYINVANPTYPAGAQIVPSYFIDNINLVEYKYYIKTLSLFGTQMAVSSDLLVDTGTVSVDTTGYDATSYWCVLVRESRSDGVAVEMASDMFAITNSITIGGTVYDAENGTPLGDAKVALYQNGLWYNTTSNTTTGEYSLDDLTADVDISVNVTHPGYIHDDYTFTPLVAGVIPIDIYMLQEDPGITYTGTAIGGLVLYAPYHQALNGATANLWNSTWNDNTTSSSTGYYLFDDIANGTFTGNAAMSGYSSASNEDVTTSLGAYTYQNYLLQPLNILTVKAKDTSTHATIMTFSAVFEEDTTYETTDGFVNITAGIGIYKVEVTAEGYYVGIDYATVVSDTELVLYLVPIDESGQGTYYDYHYVEFIVSDAGTRCAGVNTTVYLATNGTALQNGITGTNGGVVFELSEDVKYTLTFINESQSIDKTITLYPLGNLYYIYINESYTFDPGNVSTGLTNYSTTNTSRDWAIHNLTSHDLNSTIGLGILGQGIVASTVVWCIVGAGGPAAAFAAIAAMAALGIVTWILVLFCGMTAVSLYILGGKIR